MGKLFRWTGALVFLLSLLSIAFVYMVRLGVPAPDSGQTTRDVVFNVTLFTIFALHHSIMARTGAKAWITRLAPPKARSLPATAKPRPDSDNTRETSTQKPGQDRYDNLRKAWGG